MIDALGRAGGAAQRDDVEEKDARRDRASSTHERDGSAGESVIQANLADSSLADGNGVGVGVDYRARLGEACEPQASDRVAGVWLGAGNASAARATESARRPRVAPFAGAGHGGVARPPLGRVSNPFATSLANTRQKALDTLRWASWVSGHYSDLAVLSVTR